MKNFRVNLFWLMATAFICYGLSLATGFTGLMVRDQQLPKDFTYVVLMGILLMGGLAWLLSTLILLLGDLGGKLEKVFKFDGSKIPEVMYEKIVELIRISEKEDDVFLHFFVKEVSITKETLFNLLIKLYDGLSEGKIPLWILNSYKAKVYTDFKKEEIISLLVEKHHYSVMQTKDVILSGLYDAKFYGGEISAIAVSQVIEDRKGYTYEFLLSNEWQEKLFEEKTKVEKNLGSVTGIDRYAELLNGNLLRNVSLSVEEKVEA